MARAISTPVAASISFKTFFIALLPSTFHPYRKKDQPRYVPRIQQGAYFMGATVSDDWGISPRCGAWPAGYTPVT